MSSTIDTTGLPAYQMYIDGHWVAAGSGARYATTNPYTQEPWSTAPDAGAADVDRAVAAARAALTTGPWSTTTGAERARLMRTLADLLERDAAALGAIETTDNGKLLREMAAQMAYLPQWYRYYAGIAETLGGDTLPSDRPNFFIYTRREPVGVVGAILPWNSPLMLLAWKLAPALAAGCTLVVKPSDYTPASTLEFAQRMDEAGFSAGVFNVVTGTGPEVGKALAGHPGIDKVAFTGSTTVGIEVGRAALQNMTRVLLELGGKSAQLVFPDADLEAAANGVIAGVFAATGQTCLAGSRLLVHESVHDELVELIVRRAQTIVLGDPTDPATEMGPVANERQLASVLGMIDKAVADGATVATGGGRSPSPGGLFVEPTVLTDVRPDMSIAQEEVFGPVLAVTRFSTEDEALELANGTRYGLAAGVWTRDLQRAHRVAAAVTAGTVWINAYRVVGPGVPFGGFKGSGWGRENGPDAVLEFTETKAVWVELTGATRDPFTIG
ncbi:aldehyde dehydrogenase [Rhodococcus opacus]|nr:aldehyde dehydrogenase [Rhodococcus opacus]RZL79852.1 MAG: aldehyde dehydrogenase [Rhodococcus sp. (in: high G+C Gram-positive bacteria)]